MKPELQKQFAYKYKGKKHYKHVIVIPEEITHKLGWEAGEELEIRINDRKLVVGK